MGLFWKDIAGKQVFTNLPGINTRLSSDPVLDKQVEDGCPFPEIQKYLDSAGSWLRGNRTRFLVTLMLILHNTHL